jgi:hypothetical protein
MVHDIKINYIQFPHVCFSKSGWHQNDETLHMLMPCSSQIILWKYNQLLTHSFNLQLHIHFNNVWQTSVSHLSNSTYLVPYIQCYFSKNNWHSRTELRA